MKVPMKVDYGVRALVELALNYGEGAVQTAEIAYRQGIPEAYLDQLMTTLHKLGFIISRRGPQGGHRLAMDPNEIKLSMVMAAFDETETIIGCLENTATCTLSDSCGQRNIWQTVDEAVNEILERTTIADLLKPSILLGVDSSQKSIREP